AAGAGIEVANGIVVDERCRTSAPDVYAAGDVANHPNPILGRRIRVEHWQNAQHQATAAARNMVGRDEPFVEVPWVWSDQYDLNLQVAGLPSPDDELVFRGDVEARSFTALCLRDGALVAAVGVNRADDVHAARRLIQAGARPDPHVLGDADVPLDGLAAGASA
ncbi:MAG: oxidoreductase C-terminal domain-containing protein, partial [Candidatus Binatia bacterium]